MSPNTEPQLGDLRQHPRLPNTLLCYNPRKGWCQHNLATVAGTNRAIRRRMVRDAEDKMVRDAELAVPLAEQAYDRHVRTIPQATATQEEWDAWDVDADRLHAERWDAFEALQEARRTKRRSRRARPYTRALRSRIKLARAAKAEA